ncbi:piggyBac transposable element-derived protein 4-like [Saccostrea cucullata]|uniref:piggyBac transposable element-derived protein 4-like n=1 Tax=Saccostrea cuccullata TaxID=36930 RepID=UPI002ED30546
MGPYTGPLRPLKKPWFDADDLEFDEENLTQFQGDEWMQGNLHFRDFNIYGEKKINVDLGENAEMIDFVKLFIDDHVMDIMVQETNKYAADFLASLQGQNLKRQSRFRKWNDVSQDDMMRFLAIIIGMRLVQLQDIQDYWSKDELLETPGLRKILPKNKFLLMLSLLHVCNNDNNIPRGQDGHDPIFKIRRIFDHLKQKFADVYSPGENVAIDEGMVAWRGNLSFRVYMPDKPDKFGVKFFMFCDSSNGYCSQIEIYTGSSDAPSEKEKIYDLVMRLMKPYLNKGHKLYVDNF